MYVMLYITKSALNIKVDSNTFKIFGFSILNFAFSRKNHFQAFFSAKVTSQPFFLQVV